METATLEKIKKNYQVIQSSTHGNGENLIIATEGKNFAIVSGVADLTVYECFKSGKDWEFLPSSKAAKSLAPIKKFIDNKIAKNI